MTLLDEAYVCFVDQSGGLQRVAEPFPVQIFLSETVQFAVNQWNQFVPRRFVSVAPREQQFGNFVGRGHL